MVHRLRSLVTDNAGVAVLQTMPMRRLAAPMHDQPEEKLDTRRRRRLPDQLRPKRSRRTNEHRAIGRRRGVLSVRR